MKHTFPCGAWASHCSGFSCCGAQALGVWASGFVAHRLSSCSLWALECAGSVVVAHRFSCSAVCGIFLDKGSNPCPLHWKGHVDTYSLCHQGSLGNLLECCQHWGISVVMGGDLSWAKKYSKSPTYKPSSCELSKM